MPLDDVGLAQSRRRVPSPIRSIRLDFLGPWPFRCEDPRSWVLDRLGFPWILSFEARLFNGLRGLKLGNFFSPFSLALRGATTSECGLGHAEAPDCCSWGRLTLVSDFLQEIAEIPSNAVAVTSLQTRKEKQTWSILMAVSSGTS
jgi:hypothetical protein